MAVVCGSATGEGWSYGFKVVSEEADSHTDHVSHIWVSLQDMKTELCAVCAFRSLFFSSNAAAEYVLGTWSQKAPSWII